MVMIKSVYKYSDITEKIIGCSMPVHKKLVVCRVTQTSGNAGQVNND
jgi:hypothetical protein